MKNNDSKKESVNNTNLKNNLEIGSPGHWKNSSNVLCNYMKKAEYLELVLHNRAIIPRYVMEHVEYLGLTDIKKICFPMTCFCDIPFSKASSHMDLYGGYGIALDKNAVLNKYRLQPVIYINSNSPLSDDFREVFNTYYGKEGQVEDQKLLDYVLSTLVYMKPIAWPKEDEKGDIIQCIYQDECEWRYLPSDSFPEELGAFILPQQEMSQKVREARSEVLVNHPETWLSFEWKDVRYLMVPDDSASERIIQIIDGLNLEQNEKYELISKIEISGRFKDNM